MKANIPNAINKIQWAREICKEAPEFYITIEKDGKIVYRNKAFGGVLNFVQSIDEVNPKEGSISGDSQAFGFGNPYVQLFAFDQLKKKLIPVMEKIISEWEKRGKK